MSSNRELEFAFCVDKGFALPLAVSLASLDRAHTDEGGTVHILFSGLSVETRERISSGVAVLKIVWHEVPTSSVHLAHHSTFLSPASLYRLLLGDILPAGVERVMYLDADTVVEGSLREAFETEMDERAVAAVRDAASPWAAGPLGSPWQDLGLEPSSAYFNSGVMVIDLDRWRAERVGEQALELLRGLRPRWGDQDSLNAVLEGHWKELPRRWNLQTPDAEGNGIAWALWRGDVEDALRTPAVIHFTGRDKPWSFGTDHPMSDRWFESLSRTSWSSWRPKPPPQNRFTEVLTGSLRSLRDRRAKSRAALPD